MTDPIPQLVDPEGVGPHPPLVLDMSATAAAINQNGRSYPAVIVDWQLVTPGVLAEFGNLHAVPPDRYVTQRIMFPLEAWPTIRNVIDRALVDADRGARESNNATRNGQHP